MRDQGMTSHNSFLALPNITDSSICLTPITIPDSCPPSQISQTAD
jgi:hypothetical protein